MSAIRSVTGAPKSHQKLTTKVKIEPKTNDGVAQSSRTATTRLEDVAWSEFTELLSGSQRL